jgi:hypothetical protein
MESQMITSRKSMAAAALAGFSVLATGFAAASLPGMKGSAAAVTPSQRIAAAFAALPRATAEPAQVAAAKAARKGDLPPSLCAAQSWPEIEPGCLHSEGQAGRPVRTVTIGFQSGETTTVLLRVPAPQVASR